ncbi:LOW QUALITY PROTEIN: 1-aminocyclopropane-1-carboxylate synthase-like protein 1 [Phaethornis superciliosus]
MQARCGRSALSPGPAGAAPLLSSQPRGCWVLRPLRPLRSGAQCAAAGPRPRVPARKAARGPGRFAARRARSCRLTRPDTNFLEPHLFQYSDTQGSRSFREEIAKFLTGYARAAKALNPEHITVMNGCYAAFATVLSTVLGVPGDGYLIPAPYCGSINSKTWLYGGIQPVHGLFSEVADEESHPFQLTFEKLEDAL